LPKARKNPCIAPYAETAAVGFIQEVFMPDSVPVTLEVEAAAAAALSDARTRAAMGRLVSRVLRPHLGPSDLAPAT